MCFATVYALYVLNSAVRDYIWPAVLVPGDLVRGPEASRIVWDHCSARFGCHHLFSDLFPLEISAEFSAHPWQGASWADGEGTAVQRKGKRCWT